MIPAWPLPNLAREERPLYVLEQTVYLRTRFGWLRIPRGYVTDFGSMPPFATAITLVNLRPLGAHAWAALGHDWLYAIGEPGYKRAADLVFRDQMALDGVPALRREIMYRAVRLGGRGPYAKAHSWWDEENFADPATGERVPAPFPRVDAYAGQRWGLRPQPDWLEIA